MTPGKRPWALAAQAPKFEVVELGGTISGGGGGGGRGAFFCDRLASSVCPRFVEASLTVEKAVSCYKTDQLVASLLSFCSFSCRLHAVNALVLIHCPK